jgi:hypothetical protein
MCATSPPHPSVDINASISDDEEGEEEDDEAFEPMLTALGAFSKDLRRMTLGADIQKRIGTQLSDRAAEITEHAIRHQVSASFDALRNVVKSHVKALLLKVGAENDGGERGTCIDLFSHLYV